MLLTWNMSKYNIVFALWMWNAYSKYLFRLSTFNVHTCTMHYASVFSLRDGYNRKRVISLWNVTPYVASHMASLKTWKRQFYCATFCSVHVYGLMDAANFPLRESSNSSNPLPWCGFRAYNGLEAKSVVLHFAGIASSNSCFITGTRGKWRENARVSSSCACAAKDVPLHTMTEGMRTEALPAVPVS